MRDGNGGWGRAGVARNQLFSYAEIDAYFKNYMEVMPPAGGPYVWYNQIVANLIQTALFLMYGKLKEVLLPNNFYNFLRKSLLSISALQGVSSKQI